VTLQSTPNTDIQSDTPIESAAVETSSTAAPTPAAPVAAAAVKTPVAKPASKPAATAAATPKAAAKAPTKASTKAPVKAAVKTAKATKTAAPKAEASASSVTSTDKKLPKEKKIKMVRDSISMPKAEYSALDSMKLRAGKLGMPVKKTELIRAGIKALAALGDAAFANAIKSVPSLKTGRPSKAK